MKKFYVLAAATMLVASANAAGVQKRSAATMPAKVQTVQMNTAAKFGGVLTEANHSVKAAKKAQPVKGEPYYNRPAGGFYSAMSPEGRGYYSPYVCVKPYSPVTFVAQEADAYNWKVQLFNPELGAREYLTATSKEISVEYSQETDEVPVLSNGSTEYFINGFNEDGSVGQGHIASIADFIDWTDGILVSPKYYSGNRDEVGGGQYSLTYYTGAADAEGGTSAHWFGHNKSGWDAMGLYVEKPENPYLLRSVHVRYTALDLAAPEANIYVDVYKVASREAQAEDKKDVKLGEKICSGVGTFVKGENDAQSGSLQVTFVEEIDGLEMEVTPTIDDEILIVISGYESDAFNTFSMLISTDNWDEGYGQHAYMLGGFAEDDAQMVIGLDHFFKSAAINVNAPSVFLDVANPFMLLYITSDVPERNFDAAGNTLDKGFKTAERTYLGNEVSLFSITSSEEMTFTLEDGSDLPEWLTINAEDQEEAGETGEMEFSGEVILTVEAAANTGADREAVVKIAIPGDVLYLTVKQEGNGAPDVKGDVNGDGVVDIADVNAAIDMVLGLADNKPAADVNGDGVVDIADINAIIDIVLGL